MNVLIECRGFQSTVNYQTLAAALPVLSAACIYSFICACICLSRGSQFWAMPIWKAELVFIHEVACSTEIRRWLTISICSMKLEHGQLCRRQKANLYYIQNVS